MTILIVDSDAYLAGIYARRFEMAKWKVLVADNATEGRKLFKKDPEVVIIDVDTVSDGIQLIKDFRYENELVRLVALTKLGDARQIKIAKHAGVDAYLLKGHFVPSEVIAKVEYLVSQK